MLKLTLYFLSAISLPVLLALSLPEDAPTPLSLSDGALTSSAAYPDHIPGPFTGGFGEESCHSCHFDYAPNDPRGQLRVTGLDRTYLHGESYRVVISLHSERLGIGGFQLAARHEDGSQAGTFKWRDDRIIYTPGIEGSVKYLQHGLTGNRPGADNIVSWEFTWRAPEEGGGPVIFHIAANAGNDDDSPFGDWVYLKELKVDPPH